MVLLHSMRVAIRTFAGSILGLMSSMFELWRLVSSTSLFLVVESTSVM